MDMRTDTEQIEELLELGCYMGPGERYLMLYEGILTITNRTGLAWWPRGNKRKIAIFDAGDCVGGLSRRQWDEILGRLQRIRTAEQPHLSLRCGCKQGPGPTAEQAPQTYPT